MSVLRHLSDVANNAILSENEKSSIETSISTIQTRLNNYFGSDVKKHFKFGSSTRGTILPRKMDEDSDIDYMVVFDDASYKPQTYLDKLKRFVEYYYSSSDIKQSNPVIVLELNHIKFELVPAINKGSSQYPSYYIPDKASSKNDWIPTDPNGFNNTLIEKNKNNNNQIKPMIRLVKYWNSLNGSPFYSFSLEQNVVNKYYSSCSNLKDYFFQYMLGFNTSSDSPQSTKDKVERAKKIIRKVKEYENDNMPVTAEGEMKKLIPTP